MADPPQETSKSTLLGTAGAAASEQYDLCLYVTGMTPRSVRAIENVRTFCKRYLEGRHTLRIFDLYQQPSLAREEQLIAAPTLVKRTPLPQRRLVGDLSNQERVLAGLGLPA
jgi:circadian clock protein KaiB